MLRDRGRDAVHTLELGLERAEDIDLLLLADREDRIICVGIPTLERPLTTESAYANSRYSATTETPGSKASARAFWSARLLAELPYRAPSSMVSVQGVSARQ